MSHYVSINKDGCKLEKTIPSGIDNLIQLTELILGELIFVFEIEILTTEVSLIYMDQNSNARFDHFLSFCIHSL